MKNLFSITIIIFLLIVISCSNNEKRRLENSIKLEVRKDLVKDSLEKDSIKQFFRDDSIRIENRRIQDSITKKRLLDYNLNKRKYKFPSKLSGLEVPLGHNDTDIIKYFNTANFDSILSLTHYEVIRPIGWSDDGKFAYILEEFTGERGGNRFVVNVLETITNKIYWSGIYDDDIEEYLGPEGISSLWNWYYNEIEKNLSAHNIYQYNDNGELEVFSLNKNIEQLPNIKLEKRPYGELFKKGICGFLECPTNRSVLVINYYYSNTDGLAPPDPVKYELKGIEALPKDSFLKTKAKNLHQAFINNDHQLIKSLIDVEEFNFYWWTIKTSDLKDSFDFSKLERTMESDVSGEIYTTKGSEFLEVDLSIDNIYISESWDDAAGMAGSLGMLLGYDIYEAPEISEKYVYVNLIPKDQLDYPSEVIKYVFEPYKDDFVFKGVYHWTWSP